MKLQLATLAVGLVIWSGCSSSTSTAADLGLDTAPPSDTVPSPDNAADALGDTIADAMGDAVPGDHVPIRMSAVCPPDTIAKDTPYALKVEYTVGCLGERESFFCSVTVDGTNLRAKLFVKKTEVGCDSTEFSTHEATCDLPALAAGDYLFSDDDCTGGNPVTIKVGDQTTGDATCQTAPCK